MRRGGEAGADPDGAPEDGRKSAVDDGPGVNDPAAEVKRLQSLLAERERRILELEAIGREDDLTGLLNRRGLYEELARALSFLDRYGMGSALLYIDLDHFKAINDHYGHAAGDAVLREVAARTRRLLRRSDVVGRIGGDEFLIIVWQANLESAEAKAAAITAAIAAGPVLVGTDVIPVAGSIGVAVFERGDTEDSVITRADRDMYRNKRERGSAPREP